MASGKIRSSTGLSLRRLVWTSDKQLTLLALLAFVTARPANSQLVQTYCSHQNTGSGYKATSWNYQSNGYCFDQCKSQYAFAVVQGDMCWCSNYIPADQVPVSSCNVKCPGFGYEQCGNAAAGLYGYVQLSLAPSGTAGAAASSTQASSRATNSPAPPSSTAQAASTPPAQQTVVNTVVNSVTVLQTITQEASVVTSVVTPVVTPVSSAAAAASSSSSDVFTTIPSSNDHIIAAPTVPASISQAPTSTWTPTPVTTVQVVTVSGAAVTQTVTSTPTVPPEALRQTPQRKSVSGGTIAGAVIGALAGLALLGGLLFFLWRRRKHQREAANDPDAETSKSPPRRNISTLSKAGLLEKGSTVPNTTRNSAHGGDTEPTSPTSERRNSRPLYYDQRLNPDALMDLDNGSHTSVASIQDNRDYTRTLGVTNPDPIRPSYEKDDL